MPPSFLFVAIALRLVGETKYFVAVVRGQARPNPVSWFCWSLAPLVAFGAQASDGVQPTEWMTLVLAVGPILVVTAALVRGEHRARVTRFDLVCGGLAITGLGAWHLTNQLALVLVLTILADVVAAVPTMLNAHRRPEDEYGPAYLLSAAAMAVTLLTVDRWDFVDVVLPLYTLAINGVLYGLIKASSTVDLVAA